MEYSMINNAGGLSASRAISLIFVDNGSLTEIPFNKFISGMGIKKGLYLMDLIEKDFGITKPNQLILKSEDGKQLDKDINLEDYFQKDKTVYVFAIKSQDKDNKEDDFEIIGNMSLEKKWSESGLQELPAIYENYLGSNIRDYLEPSNLASFDNLTAFFSEIKYEIAALREGESKIRRQKLAETVAKGNLNNYFKEKKRQFDEYLGQKEEKMREFQQHIDSFDSYVDILSKIKIDPQLGEDEKTTLIEYFDIEKLRKCKGVYKSNQDKIQQKGQEVKDEIQQYESKLNTLEGGLLDNYSEIQNSLQPLINNYADSQDTNLQGFKQLVEEKKGNPSQKDLNDFIKKEAETIIPKLQEIADKIKDLKVQLEDQLRTNAARIRDLINDIMNLKIAIKSKLFNKLKVFCTLADKHAKDIFNLEILEKFPMVYQESLKEIQRRANYKEDFLTILAMIENFGTSENRVREEFLEMYQQYLPKSFCPFLSKTFPQLKYDHIKRAVDQDLGISLSANISQSSARVRSEGDILKLLKNLNDNLESKNNKNKDLENMVANLEEENRRLGEQLRRTAMTVPNIRKLFGGENFQEKIEEMMSACRDQLNKRLVDMEERVEILKADKLSAISEYIGNQKSKAIENKRLADELAEVKELAEEYAIKLNELEKRNKQLDSLRESDKSDLDKVEEELKTARIELLEKQAEVEKLREMVREYCRKEEELRKNQEVMIVELDQTIKIKESDLLDSHQVINQNQETINKLTLENIQLKENHDRLNAEIKNISTELREIGALLEDKQKAIKENEDAISKLAGENILLAEELKDVRECNHQALIDIKEREGQIEIKEELIIKNQSTIQKLNDEIDVLKKLLEEKRAEVKTINPEIFDKKIEQLLNDKRALHEKLAVQETESEEMKKALKNYEESIKIMNKQIDNNNHELSLLREEFNKTQASEKKKDERVKELENELSAKVADHALQEKVKLMDQIVAENAKLINEKEEVEAQLEQAYKANEEMLMQYGEKIMDMYHVIEGPLNREMDLLEALVHVEEVVKNSMVKVDDFKEGDQVVCTKIKDDQNQNNKLYIVAKKPQEGDAGDVKICYLFDASLQGDFDSRIMGKITSITTEGASGIYGGVKWEFIYNVKLENVQNILGKH